MPKPTLVLTRPKAASERVQRELGVDGVISPVLEIVGLGVEMDLSPYRGVILTSANVVGFMPDLRGVPAYCVGARTAEASGADVRLIARDADDLVARIEAEGPLLHAHGVHTRGDVAKRLSLAGIETVSLAVYDQEDRAPSDEARRALTGGPAVLPLWSPRSATLVGSQVGPLGDQVQVIALSPAVAQAWKKATGGDCALCAQPTYQEMTARIAAAMGG